MLGVVSPKSPAHFAAIPPIVFHGIPRLKPLCTRNVLISNSCACIERIRSLYPEKEYINFREGYFHP